MPELLHRLHYNVYSSSDRGLASDSPISSENAKHKLATCTPFQNIQNGLLLLISPGELIHQRIIQPWLLAQYPLHH